MRFRFVLWDVIVFKAFPSKKFEPLPSQFQTLGIDKSVPKTVADKCLCRARMDSCAAFGGEQI
jgi:hypothetical protein